MSRMLPGCKSNDGPEGITTYVFMMMENRSYDHFFGSRKMLESLAGDGLVSTMTNPDLNGAPVALWEPDDTTTSGTNGECDMDPPHGWDELHASWNNGANDGFVKEHQMQYPGQIHPMQYLTRKELPVSYALADAYTSCDRWFCSVMGPTWPNRFYWAAGQSFGLMDNTLPASGQFNGASVYHRLQAKNIDWAYYYGSIPVLAVITDIDVMPHIHRFDQFMVDAAAGKLPPVVYIDPAFNDNDDHPPVHPINGQELIATVYTALATSPQWKNCMLVITYDENGGFFDHVSPGQVPDDMAAQGFGQLGFRVPAMVIGPYVKENTVISTQYDHTSALAHLENTFDLAPLTMRVSAATDLSDCIDMERLAKFDWHPPIDIPAVDPTQWPTTAAACMATGRVAPHAPANGPQNGGHPVIDWAEKHPELVAGIDLRDELPEYRKAIRDFLANTGPISSKVPVR